MKIGLFDSGIGGLTVLKEIVRLSPNHQFIYLADTANLPYGNKSREQILSYANAKMSWMRKMKMDLVVVACNTTDSVIANHMDLYKDMNVVNIISPTAQGILKEHSNIKRIGVLATEATAKNLGYENAFAGTNLEIMTVPCPELVPLIESGMNDYDLCYRLISQYMKKLFEFGMNGLIYGCTHYQLAENLIKHVIIDNGKNNVMIFDPANFVAKKVEKFVNKSNSKSEFEFYITDISTSNRLKNAVKNIFHFEPKIQLVNLNI